MMPIEHSNHTEGLFKYNNHAEKHTKKLLTFIRDVLFGYDHLKDIK
jgi:hypothetical protein